MRAAAAVIAAAAAALAGCAAAPRIDTDALEPVELTDVPFFPQTAYQCGPAALATILAYEGVPVDAGDLEPAVYVEGLRGSLQAELLAATRRYGLLPYPLEPAPEAVFAELASGKPVLVLQNLGLPRFPVWHYAVVVGFDAERERVLLRSGTEKRRATPLRRFLRSWDRGGLWSFVAVEPGELPATAGPDRYVRALADAERVIGNEAVDAAYAAAAERWPRHPLVLFGAAGADAAAGRLEAAAERYATLIEAVPEHAAAHNNLANVLAEQGCRRAASRHAQRALELVEEGSPLHAAVADTVAALPPEPPAAAGEPAGCPR